MKIDMFAHIMGPKYVAELERRGIQHHPPGPGPALISDIPKRVAVMDEFPDLTSVITTLTPPLEVLVSPRGADDLAKLCNDELAEIVDAYSKYFLGAAAAVPLADMGLAVKEAERAIEQLGFKGVQVFSNNLGSEYLDSARLYPLYELMEHYDLPMWIHPWHANARHWDDAAMTGGMLGWPLDTTLTMLKLANSEVFDRFPNLKFITHHCGAYTALFHPRMIAQGMSRDKNGQPLPEEAIRKSAERLKNFYNDTALYDDCTLSLEHCARYFGIDRIVFGTDYPSMDAEELGKNIASIMRMDIPEEDREKIFCGNALKLMKMA